MLKWILAGVMVMGLVVIGCDQQTGDATAGAASSDAIPATLVLASAPSDAKDVKAVKTGAKKGDEVIVRGVIGGRADPIADNRAIMTIIDPSLQTCNKVEGDTCATPWDACCEDQDTITAAAATVQVVGPDARPLKVGLKGHKGIEPLKEVVVVGTVQSVDEKNLVIDATGIYVRG